MDKIIRGEDEVYNYIDSLPKGSVFYDLGACIGGFSLYALSKGLKVVAFEVENANYNMLLENYEKEKPNLPKKHYFKPIQIGIADKEGEVDLRIGQPEPGGHHKTLDLETYCAIDVIIGGVWGKVKIDSLDNLIKRHNLPQPEYLKVDIDGSEYAFIQGAKETLSNVKSMIIELYTASKYYYGIMDDLDKLGFKEQSRGPMIDRDLYNITFVKK